MLCPSSPSHPLILSPSYPPVHVSPPPPSSLSSSLFARWLNPHPIHSGAGMIRHNCNFPHPPSALFMLQRWVHIDMHFATPQLFFPEAPSALQSHRRCLSTWLSRKSAVRGPCRGHLQAETGSQLSGRVSPSAAELSYRIAPHVTIFHRPRRCVIVLMTGGREDLAFCGEEPH